MAHTKEALLEAIEQNADELFAVACDIYDHPEQGQEEYFACNLLTQYLENKGFAVERGISGLETAFRAIWERGTDGPSIGFLLEYDALRGMGHACGHHLQAPVCIGVALALMECCQEPFKLVLYGTPDEEIFGGKIVMEKNGFFRDADVMFSYHTAAKTCVSDTNRALAPIRATFHGTPSHAAGSPEKGRSALDAMMLAFHGLEIMREHVADGCRIHYTVLEGTGASNIVHETAKAHITLRSYDRRYLEDMLLRAENVVEGACLMTGTTADIERKNEYWNIIPVPSLQNAVLQAAEEIQPEAFSRQFSRSGGSSDVGNVSWVVPTVLVNSYYCNAAAHSAEWLDAGKTENARNAMLSGTKIIALTAWKAISDKALLETIRQEHSRIIADTQ